MGWTYDDSLQRARKTYQDTADVTVSTVTRQTDFEAISLTKPRRVRGAHLYVDVPCFEGLLGEPEEGTDEDMLRRLHLYAREVTRILEIDFDAVKVHFQGPRLHALSYRPVNDDAVMVATAVAAAAAIAYSSSIFNDVFGLTGEAAWDSAAGIDFGEVIATKNGVGGDRELLFLGAPANYAAKMLKQGIRIAAEAAALLPEDVATHVRTTDDPAIYEVQVTLDQLEDLCATYGWTWSAAQSRSRLEEAVSKHPAGCATIKKPTVKIDKTALGLSNSKRLPAVSLFADIDGFTAYIDEATSQDEDLIAAVRAFHTLRHEMRETAVVGYDALRVQYQGDRMQALTYLPFDHEVQAALSAVRIAAALHSVATQVMPQVVGAKAAKPLAIGVAAGPVLLSKLGEHGKRDVVALGPSVAEAARIQQALDGTQTGISAVVYDLLPGWLQLYFTQRDGSSRGTAAQSTYIADGLTLDVLERAERVAQQEEEVTVASTSSNFARPSRPVASTPLRPWVR
ncbi:hypothetical protein OG218_26430 [Kineococcus sp. NBC_00420]|uniref:adenylate/guanylate cyclase domain-containing protein n=1 Tax=Kineococcus sp. NBC_00420 TaxID=2903564 RepID=UPI002E1D30E6